MKILSEDRARRLFGYIAPVDEPTWSQQFNASVSDSWKTTFGQSLIDHSELVRAKQTGNYITKEDYVAFPFLNEEEWTDKTTLEEARFISQDRLEQRSIDSVLQDGKYGSFVGDLVGSFHPIDVIALSMIPEIGVTAKLTTSLARGGLMSRMAGKSITGASAGFKEALVAEPFIYQAQTEMDRRYTVSDSLANVYRRRIIKVWIQEINQKY
jgi:hypothetical protein